MLMVCLMNLELISLKKRGQVENDVPKAIASVLPEEKIMTLYSKTDGLQLLKMLKRVGGQERKILHNKVNRSQLFGEREELVPEMGEEGVGTLKVTGFLRGVALHVNQLVHILGLEDFQMSEIYTPDDPYLRKNDGDRPCREVELLAQADSAKQTYLLKENIQNAMDTEYPCQRKRKSELQRTRKNI